MQKTKNRADCVFIRNNLFSYQEKQLSDKSCKEFQDHLDLCDDCSKVVSDFQSVMAGIGQIQADEFNPFTETRTIQRIEAELERKKISATGLFQRILQPVIISFILLFALVTGFSLGKQLNQKSSENLARQGDISAMKSGLDIPVFMDESDTFFDNH